MGRLSYGMVSLSLMLAVKETSGSYAVAGSVLALFGLTSVFLSPARAALIDRHGPRRALPPMTGAYALLLAALAHATWRPGASQLTLAVLAMAAGACTPPLGPVMRTLWSRLLPDRRLLQRAYSLDSVAEELLLVSGPLLVGLLMRFAAPAAGVAVSAALVLTGCLALVSSPAVRAMPGRARAVARPVPDGHGGQEGQEGQEGQAERKRRERKRLRVTPDLRRAVLASAGVGLCLGALELLAVAFAEQRHQAAAVAWVLAALSAGSAAGGLAYGAVSWRAPERLRLPVLTAALALILAAAGLAPGLLVFTAVVGVAGLFVAPALTSAYLLADQAAAPESRTQAGAWVNTALNAGVSGGTAAVGLLVGRLPLAACFAVAAAPALLCAAGALYGAGGLRRSTP
ncbi:MFS transporter [Streptomyces sp. N2-109]|uniref:MFS transporter n=1 Tax=Streptomyces gossypii TaxID=2883101 RepID=A0ABT2JM22_9ACTN|nr:MFS transporter [Streptomyces gossypii]MCT2588937.1 MFS transporter [Streptomyces gossypii]